MQVVESVRPLESHQFDAEHRRYYDTVTWLAEVLPGSMRTPFEYSFDGKELYAEDGGALKPIFKQAIEKSESLPMFERRRRRLEYDEYQAMLTMARGELPNTMVVVSDFPPEMMTANEDMGGYNISRKQTMLRVITREANGKLKMRSQSLDGSDRQALEAIYEYLGFRPTQGELLGQRMYIDMDEQGQEFIIDKLTGVYDRQLGEGYYAGIKDVLRMDTYSFACRQTDLLRAYLATTNRFSEGEAEYNLATAVRARYLASGGEQESFVAKPVGVYGVLGAALHALALEEMWQAGNEARQQGVIVSGCGATINLGTGSISEYSVDDQLAESGYGNKSDKLPDDKYGSRYFKCPKGHENVRLVRDKLIERCQICNCDVSC